MLVSISRTLLIVILMILATASMAAAQYPPETEEHLIDAGSYRLFVRVLRGEGPVILLESGGGGESSEYSDLAPRIHAQTGATVVAYDRPGFGGSDLPELPCDMREESQSLWRALAILGFDSEVIPVGWSYGGWMSRLHANDHPDQVVGIVFIDPFNSRFVEALGVDYCDRHPMMGFLPFQDDDPASLSPVQLGLIRMVGKGTGPKLSLMKTTRLPADIPIRLISSRLPFLPEDHEQQKWWQAHREIADKNPGVVLVEAHQSSHGIIYDEFDLVLEQIVQVVNEVRGR